MIYSSTKFAPSMKKERQIGVMVLVSTVLGISWKEAEQRKQLAKLCLHRAIANQFSLGSKYYLLSIKAGPAGFYQLNSVAVPSSLPARENQNLREKYAANNYVSSREGGCTISLDLGVIMQCLA